MDDKFKECMDYAVVIEESDRSLKMFYDTHNYRVLRVDSEILDWRITNNRMIVKCENRKILVFTDDFCYPTNVIPW